MALILEVFYLFILVRVCERHTELTALRSEEASTCHGHTAHHVFLSYALHHLLVGMYDIRCRHAHVAAPAKMVEKGAFKGQVTHGVASGIEIEQTIEANRYF